MARLDINVQKAIKGNEVLITQTQMATKGITIGTTTAGTDAVAASRTFGVGTASLAFTAVTAGTAGNSISVLIEQDSGTSKPLAVSVVNNAITIKLPTDESGIPENATAAQVKTAYDLVAAATSKATVAISGGGGGTVFSAATQSLTGGAAAGKEIQTVTESAGLIGNYPLLSGAESVTVTAGESAAERQAKLNKGWTEDVAVVKSGGVYTLTYATNGNKAEITAGSLSSANLGVRLVLPRQLNRLALMIENPDADAKEIIIKENPQGVNFTNRPYVITLPSSGTIVIPQLDGGRHMQNDSSIHIDCAGKFNVKVWSIR